VDTARGPRPDQPRIPLVTDPTPEAQAILDGSTGLRAPNGDPISVLRTVANNPVALRRFHEMGGLLGDSTVPRRELEIAILRVGWNCRSVYEFGQHTRLGRRFGLTDEEIAAIAGGDVDRFSPEDRELVALADDLCEHDCVSDTTWAALTSRYSTDQMIEMVMIAGFYRLVSCFLNSAGVALEEGTPGWPPGVVP
jgi:alkylhydroperoxidase family enzyme